MYAAIRCNFVVFKHFSHLLELMNSCIGHLVKLDSWDNSFRQAILDERCFDAMLSLYEEVFHYPLIVFNPSFTAISHTAEKAENNKSFNAIVQLGHLTNDFTEYILKAISSRGSRLL